MNSAFQKLSKNSKLTTFLTQKTPILESILSGKTAAAATSRVDALDAKDMETYFASTQAHKDMMDRYWPTNALTSEEKLKRTANTVGFDLPTQGSPLSDLERQAQSIEEGEKILATATA